MSVCELRRSMAEAKRRDRGFLRRPRILDYLGAGGTEEAKARQTAETLVQRAREESGRRVEGPAPDPDAVRERREALHEPGEDY